MFSFFKNWFRKSKKQEMSENKQLKVLELFAGSRSVGRAAEELGMEVFSVDWEKYEGINLSIDIEDMRLEDVPFVPDFVWASPDCTTYSIAAVSSHRRNRTEPVSEYAIKCDNVNKHWISLIKKWLEINPNMVFFIENPRGMLRHMPFMQEFNRHTVWYCKYGDDRAKPTDIWTNSKTWIPREECHNYKYDKEGNIVNKHCHHESARRGAKTGTQGRQDSYNRSKIPNELCVEILSSLIQKEA
jgi:site-specific DNA-cytosine methylase